jgi:glutamyl-tRNA synthetase
VEQSASAPHLEHEGPPYPGTCAVRTVADAAGLEDRPYSWRVRARGMPAEFVDGFVGLTRTAEAHRGDFVVWKSAGTPAYQLAVVVDDADMGVTEVVRGDDLMPSTPRQLHLYHLLQLPTPSFGHVPLVVGPDGRRLAKRHGDTRLSALRGKGVKPEALLGLLAWSCGWLPEITPISLAELLPLFRLEKVPPTPFVLTPEMLRRIGYT